MWPVHPDHEGVVYELEEEEEEEEELIEEEEEVAGEHRIAPAGPYGTNASVSPGLSLSFLSRPSLFLRRALTVRCLRCLQDTGLAWVSVDEHRQQLLRAEQARARAVAHAMAQ